MKKTHIVGIVFIVLAIGAIISTVYKADSYACFAQAQASPGQQMQIIGELLLDKPIEEKVEGNTLYFSFYMQDPNGKESKVVYMGGKPQDFERLDQVVIVGSYGEDFFLANNLLLKCPSKYNADEF